MTNRRAIIYLPYEAVATMLELPAGLTVHAIFADFQRDALAVKVGGDHLDEVPDGMVSPQLPIPNCYLVDSEPVLDALRTLHYPTEGVCFHCEDPWPCPTMTVAAAEALAHPLATRRLKVDLVPDES